MTENDENQPSAGPEASPTPATSRSAVACVAVTCLLFCASMVYAFDLATPAVNAALWAAGNPQTASTIFFAVMFVGGFLIRNSIVAAIGAVGFLAVVVGLYVVAGWYSFLSTGHTPEGVPIEVVTPAGAALILVSGFGLLCCVVGHLAQARVLEKALLIAGVFVVLSTFFYYALDDHSTSRHSVAVKPPRVHPDHLSSLVPEDCTYERGGFVRCAIRRAR